MAALLFLLLLPGVAAGQVPFDDAVWQRGDLGGGGRVPFPPSQVHLAMADGSFTPPTEDADGWQQVEKREDGSLAVRAGQWVYMTAQSPREQVVMLEASGHGMVYANGEPRPGDPYGYGWLELPVLLQEGTNTFLFRHSRGQLNAKLTTPPAEVFFLPEDVTSPDFLAGRDETLPLGMVVVNATPEPVTVTPWSGDTDPHGEHARVEGGSQCIPALSIRKLNFPIVYDGRQGESFDVSIGLADDVAEPTSVTLNIRQPGQMYKRTFISRIDGSVQYYAIQPRKPGVEIEGKPGLVLSLHGASVEATNQANAYSPKDWCDIVCPTNRRPFGFDWEDWGRVDAMEVLDEAMRHLGSDPHRVYLTGHSMGGHGTWSIGTLHADRFAAIAPSAGWLSFASYTGAGHNELLAATEGIPGLFADAARIAQTENRMENLRGKGIYILHGDADDNVPVREAREAKRLLEELDMDFQYHEEPGAGHWWDGDRAAGADCVDWPEIFEMFKQHRLENPPAGPAADDAIVSRGFKRVFDNNALLVWEDASSPEMAEWARAKARYDHEQMYYRGNGGFEMMGQALFMEQLEEGSISGRNVVLYGGEDSHTHFGRLRAESGDADRQTSVESTPRWLTAEQITVVAVAAEPVGQLGFLGFVGANCLDDRTLPAARLTSTLPYFVSGVHFPDFTFFDATVFEKGIEGILWTGDFEEDPAQEK